MRNPKKKLLAGAFVTLGATALFACSLIVDTNADPCSSSADCPVPGSVCGPDRICTKPLAAAEAGVEAGVDAGDCTDQRCCSAAQCRAAHGGDPYTCPKPGEACVPLKTAACDRLLGNDKDPNALVVGILVRLSDSNGPLSLQLLEVMDLAISEVNGATLGIPGPAGKPARPIVGVVCDELIDTEGKHLIDELHVPGLIVLGSSAFTVGLAPKLVATDTFAMCPNCGSPALTTLDDKNLIWRTQPAVPDLGKAMAAYFPELEAKVRAAFGLGSSAIKVAVANNKSFLYTSATENFVGGLTYNGGKTALQNGANFLRVDFDDPATVPTVDLQAVANQIIAYAPPIVAISANVDGVAILTAIEAGWTGPGPKLYYLGQSALETPELNDYVAAHPTISARIRLFDFTTPVESGNVFSSYALRLNSQHPTNDPLGNSNIYDGTYAALYAIAAVDPTLPLTGSLIAQQVPRLGPPGGTTKLGVGPTDFPTGVSLLRKGGAIDLLGTFTDLNFDTNGDVHGDSALFCVTSIPTALDAGGPSYGLFVTKRVYTSATGQLTGTDDCP